MKPSAACWRARIGLALILLLSLILNTVHNGFPSNYHGDEPKKVSFIREHTQDFMHPLLMLQCGRMAARVTGATEPGDVVRAGRTMSACFGVLAVWFTYALARLSMGRGGALLTALCVAVSPIVVVHAHYLKEDIYLTAFTVLTLLCLVKVAEKGGWRWTAGLGLALGGAVSSHFKGLVLVLPCLAAPAVMRGARRWRFARDAILAIGLGAAVFAAVNAPVFAAWDRFSRTQADNLENILAGHTLIIRPGDMWFGFHLRYSLLPGLTAPTLALAGAGMVIGLRRWRGLADAERILLLAIAALYLAVETVPFKTFPDFMRYVLPLAPLGLVFAVKTLTLLHGLVAAAGLRWAATAGAAAVILYPAWQSAMLVGFLEDDTRRYVEARVPVPDRFVLYEKYSRPEGRGCELAAAWSVPELRRLGVRVVVSNSFQYERFRFGARLPRQPSYVYTFAQRYQELFRYPYIEIRPSFRSYAFSNPTLRIVDIHEPERSGPP